MIKKVFLLLCLLCSFALKSQNVDSRIGQLINKSDWFALDKEYPVVKDSLLPIYKWYAKALLDVKFNRLKEASISIDTLLSSFQLELDVTDSFMFFYYSGFVLREQGMYKEGANLLKRYLDAADSTSSKNDMRSYIEYYNFTNALRYEKAPEIDRPLKDIVLPVQFIPIYQVDSGLIAGTNLVVPVIIHGKSYRFLFDTGANYCLVPEKTAKEVGIRVLVDSVLVSGVYDSNGHKCGVLDSISMGDITYKNGLFIVTNDKLDSDSAIYSGIDGIVGLNFMRAIGEMIFYPRENKMVLPYKQTELPITGRNIMLDDHKNVIVQAFTDEKPILFHFDTGNTNINFNYPYYLKNKEWFDSNPVKQNWNATGVGGVITYDTYRSPEFPLTIGGLSFEIAGIPTIIDPNRDTTPVGDGALGMDFFMPFSKVILNFDKMFVEFEK